jgi:predicted nucleic acid-binding protein
VAAYVFDASVMAALHIREDDSAASLAAFAQLGPADEVHAPDFMLLEVANVLWKHVRRRTLTGDVALRAVNDLAATPIHFHPTGLLAPQALVLALAHGFTSYDASYVALATRVGGTVVTNDRKLHRRGVEAGLPVVAAREMT